MVLLWLGPSPLCKRASPGYTLSTMFAEQFNKQFAKKKRREKRKEEEEEAKKKKERKKHDSV